MHRGVHLQGGGPHVHSVAAYKYHLEWGRCGSGLAETGTSFSLKNSILLYDKCKPVLYTYMLQRIEIPPTPISAVVMTVNTTAGNPMLIPFGPSQSAGTVRPINAGGTVTFAEARQAAAYAGIKVSKINLHTTAECTYHRARESTRP